MKEDTSTWCLFPRDMLGQCWRDVGVSLRYKLTRNCDVFCDVCLEVFTIQCVVLILQIEKSFDIQYQKRPYTFLCIVSPIYHTLT